MRRLRLFNRSQPRRQRLHAQVALVVVSVGLTMVLVPSGLPVLSSSARAGLAPTPLITSLLKPSSSPSPSPSEDEEEEEVEEPKEESEDRESQDSRKRRRNESSKRRAPRAGTRPSRSSPKTGAGPQRQGKTRGRARANKGSQRASRVQRHWSPRTLGAYSTESLVSATVQLQSLGIDSELTWKRIYSPFIVAGQASWTDSWGAPRYGPGRRVRTHQGQDIFCDQGAPLLAPESGRVEFGFDDLGGRIARLQRRIGGYWYFAHLADWNDDELSSGDFIPAGTVIGYCGNTGNARTTPPHVHFGLYDRSGAAVDPLSSLIGWLKRAERKALHVVETALGERSELQSGGLLDLRRHFGEAFLPSFSLRPCGPFGGHLAGASPDPLSFWYGTLL